MSAPVNTYPPAEAQTFPPTMWSMVRRAVMHGEPGASSAMNELCRLYERPILACIQRHGHPPDAA